MTDQDLENQFERQMYLDNLKVVFVLRMDGRSFGSPPRT
jgi:hypothetical protein